MNYMKYNIKKPQDSYEDKISINSSDWKYNENTNFIEYTNINTDVDIFSRAKNFNDKKMEYKLQKMSYHQVPTNFIKKITKMEDQLSNKRESINIYNSFILNQMNHLQMKKLLDKTKKMVKVSTNSVLTPFQRNQGIKEHNRNIIKQKAQKNDYKKPAMKINSKNFEIIDNSKLTIEPPIKVVYDKKLSAINTTTNKVNVNTALNYVDSMTTCSSLVSPRTSRVLIKSLNEENKMPNIFLSQNLSKNTSDRVAYVKSLGRNSHRNRNLTEVSIELTGRFKKNESCLTGDFPKSPMTTKRKKNFTSNIV